MFVRGSRQRLEAVQDGRCHLAAMSAFAAAELCGPTDQVVVELPPLTYNTGHRVFYKPTADDDPQPLRVIIDRHSADQQLLTAMEFAGTDVRLIPAMGAQIARMLAEGLGDAAVWTIDEMRVRWPEGVLDRPLSPAVREQLGDRDTRAVLIGRAAEAAVLGAITAPVDGDEVERIQLDVMAGGSCPNTEQRGKRRTWSDERDRRGPTPVDVRDGGHDPPVRAARHRAVPPRQHPWLSAPVPGRGGDRGRRDGRARAGRLHRQHAPRPRPRDREGPRPEAHDGRALRQGDRLLPTAAADRCTSPVARSGTSGRTVSSAAGSAIAAGAALAIKQRGGSEVVVAFCSDGSSANGIWHESLNLAAIWDLPVIFVLENNQYAVSTPIRDSARVEHLSPARGRLRDARRDGRRERRRDRLRRDAGADPPGPRRRGTVALECMTYRHGGHHVNDPGLYLPGRGAGDAGRPTIR